MGKPWENGDSYGKIHHVQWVNQLFRLGHVQVRKLLVRLPEGIYYCIVSDKKTRGIFHDTFRTCHVFIPFLTRSG